MDYINSKNMNIYIFKNFFDYFQKIKSSVAHVLMISQLL